MTRRLHGWLRTAEAALALAVAHGLVRLVPFRTWQGWFARGSVPSRPSPDAATLRHRSAAIERAAARMPGDAPCLPRALAMALMLRRRGFGSQLQIGVRPPAERDGREDLHAWLTHRGQVIYGERQGSDVAFAAYALGSR